MDTVLERARSLVDKNKIKEAIELLQSHEDSRMDCAFALYEIYSNSKNEAFFEPERAKNIVKKLNHKKYIPAKFEWAKMFFYGKLEEKNYESAEKIFREVANFNLENNKEYFEEITKSALFLGKMYEEGYHGDKDLNEALRHYKTATKNDNLIEAYFSSAKLILENSPKDYHEAILYLEHAASKKHLSSIKLLSKTYIKLGKVNLEKVTKLDSKSVDAIIVLDKLNKVDENLLI